MKNMMVVTYEQLAERVETVKVLEQGETEQYLVVKDLLTGDHYLQYAYVHRNLAEGGEEETFLQLLPLESDDVLAIILCEKEYAYPEHWRGMFLRSGNEGNLFWYNPAEKEEIQQYGEIAEKMQHKLNLFKEAGSLDDDSIRKLMEEMDRMFEDK